jgi:hypothetical protein
VMTLIFPLSTQSLNTTMGVHCLLASIPTSSAAAPLFLVFPHVR